MGVGFCATCGGILEAEDRFCGTCGAPVPEVRQDPVPKTTPTPPPPPVAATAKKPLSQQTIGLLALAGLAAVVIIVFVTQRSGSDLPGSATPTSPTATSGTVPATQATTPISLPELPAGTPYSGYEMITDDTGLLQVAVPVEWTDRNGEGWNIGGERVGPAVIAAPDAAAWAAGWDTPGMLLAASSTLGLTPDQVLDAFPFDDACTYSGREPYDDGVYVGVFDEWIDCGGTQSDFGVIAAQPADASALIFVQMLAVTDADVEAISQIVASFQLTGPLGG